MMALYLNLNDGGGRDRIMAEILTTSSDVKCPHGGIALLTSSDTSLSTNRKRLLLQSDIHSIQPGCILHPPCTILIWLKGSKGLKHKGVAIITSKSEGRCMPSQASPIIAAQKTVISNG